MKKIVNGVEVELTLEEQEALKREWAIQAEEDQKLLEEQRVLEAQINAIGNPSLFLYNLCKHLNIDPEVVRKNAP